MDIPLGIKIINMVYKITTSRQNEIPENFGNYRPEYLPAPKHDDLKLTKKYELNDRFIDDFISNLKEDNRVNLSGIGILYKGRLVREEYVYPYTSKYRHVSFSMCKSIVAMAVGIAIEKKLIKLEERIIDIFPEFDTVFVKKGIKSITVRNLLTMTTGAYFDELSAYFSDNWLISYFNGDVMFEPDSEFSYNSLNTYILVAVIRKRTGMSLEEFLDKHLFKYLNISDITWDMSPEGMEQGGWGVKISIPDMLKLGQLYLNKGCVEYNDKKINVIPSKWIEESTSIQVKLNDKEVVSGYGYHIWILQDGAYLFNGLFGQNVYVNPEKELVVAITASAYEIFPGGSLVSKLCDFSGADTLYDTSFITGIKNLLKRPRYELIKREKIKYDEDTFFYVLSEYMDIKYVFEEYAASILPISIQGLYSMFSSGIKAIQFKRIDDRFCMLVNENDCEYTILLGYKDNSYEYQVIDIKGKKIPIAANCSFAFDEDDDFLLKIKLDYLEEVGNRIFKIYLKNNYILLKATEVPDLQEFTGMLFGESKIRRTKNLKKIKAPDYMEYKINKILSPVSKGIKIK